MHACGWRKYDRKVWYACMPTLYNAKKLRVDNFCGLLGCTYEFTAPLCPLSIIIGSNCDSIVF